ncbi:hypothetical protein [Polyangium spumosum]|uniref:DUF998 domain-containing protein n=1 Tax=Polyangium spumosum TaxID=889282 RepID=A0A6N7PQL9_9BACT|nr:hypothetical protein [Polyangium spumosum]MRG92404.1 hypothetical protein [Polyangium spumosum]
MAPPADEESPPHGSATPPLAVRAAALFVIGSVACSCLLLGAAMALYPGGTWLDRAAAGHDFFRNFLCDLTADRALDGRTNPGAWLAKAGMMALAAGTLPFWFLVTRLFAARVGLSVAVRVFGLASALAATLVPLAPSQRYGLLHALLILVAGAPGLVAAALATFGLLSAKGGPRAPARLAACTVGLAALDGALYAAHVASGEEVPSALLPALQKLAALALVAWMTGTAVITATLNRPSSRRTSPGAQKARPSPRR